jgi:signal transduction histidine kinase
MAWDTASTPQNKPARKSQNELFRRSRLRLAIWYVEVMGVILALLGLGVYQAIAHAHKVTIDREVKSVADTIHNTLEATVFSPDQLHQVPSQLLPNLCLSDQPCMGPKDPQPHHLQRAHEHDNYIQIVAPSGSLLATAGIRPEALPVTVSFPIQPSIEGKNGTYHQVAIALHNRQQETWAYLLVGRSFQEFDRYMDLVRWCLIVGLLLSLALVAAASWWLAALAMRPIYQSYNQIQQFTADAAHELRTPLAAIRATVESMLRLPHLSEREAEETMTVINRQSQRLTTLVSDLLLLSRLDSERPLMKSPCCLQNVLSDIDEEMAAFALFKQVKLTVDIQTPQPLVVLGDEEQLYRLVLNLVNNALTYTPAGGQVTLTLKRHQQQALILVSDTGIGIASEHQGKIFDRFYRVDAARSHVSIEEESRSAGSSGLGLAIAAAITHFHHGTLSVTSELGQGSTFAIALPVSS